MDSVNLTYLVFILFYFILILNLFPIVSRFLWPRNPPMFKLDNSNNFSREKKTCRLLSLSAFCNLSKLWTNNINKYYMQDYNIWISSIRRLSLVGDVPLTMEDDIITHPRTIALLFWHTYVATFDELFNTLTLQMLLVTCTRDKLHAFHRESEMVHLYMMSSCIIVYFRSIQLISP